MYLACIFLEPLGSQECVSHATVKATKHPTVGSYFSSANKCALGTRTKPANQLPPPQMLFSCSSLSQYHKYNCVIVPMSLYIETEITQRGLVSEKKTTWPQTRDCQWERRDSKSDRGRLRGNETDKWRWSLWMAMTCASRWYNEGREDAGWERAHFDGAHFRLLRLDNGFRHHSVFTVGARCWGSNNVLNRKKET